MELRYLGFDQLQNARAFRFDILTKGEVPKHATVTADMALFLQFRVGIQDGPTLCANKLAADIEKNVDGDHVLTADDLRAFSDSRTAAEEKRIEMRRMASRRHTPSPGSNPGTAAFGNPRGRL